LLIAFEEIAKENGARLLVLTDTSEFQIFRKNGGDTTANSFIATKLLSTLITGKHTSYYEESGFKYSDDHDERDVAAGAELMLGNTLDDFIEQRMRASEVKWEGVVKFLKSKGTQTNFHIVFRELHASTKHDDKQMLVDIIEERSFTLNISKCKKMYLDISRCILDISELSSIHLLSNLFIS
jgi:hypothetical protein